ncbi:M48 family metallopeptidase [Croceicoccus marinus]|uniref:Metal-dependent hydrolase n=1 Tax=Croceicoccus marinus TaxID=450378 RepID=A0A1Z1F9F7_9SPHN|nr:SprT family zinc-dependent metalloprotease [Croceicoccus marinus]ARU15382.1 metal-dependent hydrolase [Croceicoccus marinus]
MSDRARRGLENFLSRRARPPRELREELALPGGPLPLLVRPHNTARRMTLRLSPDGSEARVTVPLGVPLREGAHFARSRIDWLARQRAAAPQAKRLEHGDSLPFRGMALRIEWDKAARRQPLVMQDMLVLGGPQDGLARRIQRWLETEALALCRADLAEYCAAANVDAPDLRLSRATRRWGSCSTSGTVRINWRLVMAPDEVRRSVVAHEVAHLVHFDHSPAFHALLARLHGPGLPAADRWLKREGRSLYLHFG